jgi:HSP20 family molecular chaperone IbpA
MKSLSNRTRTAGNGRLSFDGSSPFPAFHREMDQLLENAFNGFGFTRTQSRLPAVEVQEQEKEYLVSVDLPGVEMKDIQRPMER